jgi:hypothetical protein
MKTVILFLIISIFTGAGLYGQPTGNYITMNGGSDNVYIPHSSYWNLSGDFTISMNLNFTYTNYWQMLMTHSPGGFELSFTGSQLWLSPTGIGWVLQAAWNPQANTWYHLVVTRTGSTINAYVDGQLIGTGGGSIGTANSPLRLGNYYVGGYAFYGRMDEVSMWNAGATQSYVTTVLANPLTGNEAGLVGYWKLDETGAGAGINVDNTAQLTGNTLDGITQGTASTPFFTEALPPPQYCLNFDGNDDMVNMGQILNPVFAGADKKFTIEALVYLNASDTYEWIMGKYDAWDQRQLGLRLINGKLNFFYTCGLNSSAGARSITGTMNFVPGEWYHVAVTYDGANDNNNGLDRPMLYVNGQWDPPSTTSAQYPLGNIVNGGAPFCIGGGTYQLAPVLNAGTAFDGIIKNVRVWDYLRPIIDIQNYMYNPIPDPAYQSHLKFYATLSDGAGQTITDISSSGAIGYLGMNNSPSVYDPVWVTCTPPVIPLAVPNCLDFDGIDDYVNVGNKTGFDMNFTMTVEAWIYPEGPGSGGSAGSGGAIVNKEGEFEIARFDNGYIGWAFANYSPGWVWVQTTAYTPLNQWSHIAVVYDISEVRTYLNGVWQHSYPVSGILGDVAPTYNDLWISGRQTVPGGQIFDGKMDEVRIWSIARTEAEIRQEMHREIITPNLTAGLIANYSFNLAEGTKAYDYSINLYNGTLVNMDPDTDWEVSTAPIPYNTITNGNWQSAATWNTGQNAPVNAWSRVKVNHSISLNTAMEAIDVTISPEGTLTLNQARSLTVTGDLVNEKGVSGLVLKSGTTGTATIIENDGAAASVERYFSGNDIDWHLVSSPLINAQSNVFTGKYLQWFDEASNQYIEIVPTTFNLVPAQGYAVYGTSANNKVTFTGNLNAGSVSIPVTNSATAPYGWNLVGNPFASSLDWNMVIPTLSSIGNTIYYLEASTGNWLTWNGSVGSGSQYIPPMQGFFVSATTNSTLDIPAYARTHIGSGTFYKNDISGLMVIKATGNGYADKAYIQFSNAATENFDPQADGYKIISDKNPLLPQVYTISGGINLSINTLPSCESIPLSFQSGTSGTFELALEEANDIPVLILEDTKTGTFTDMTKKNYSFTFSIFDNTDRFILHLNPLSVNDPDTYGLNIYTNRNQVYIQMNGTSAGHVTVFDLIGRQIVSKPIQNNELSFITLDEKTGVYMIHVSAGSMNVTKKVFIP